MECVTKGYHACKFNAEVRETFLVKRKREERGNTFKVVNERGQLGHLQAKLVAPMTIDDNQ